MSKLSNQNILNIILKLLALFVVAKAISLLFLWILPSNGIDFHAKQNYRPKYQRVDFKNMLQNGVAVKPTGNNTSKDGVSITSMILKGLYGKGSKGFAIVALKSSPKKTSIISVGENFSGYTLKSILKNRVIFVKMGKEYVLKVKSPKEIQGVSKVLDEISENNDGIKNVSRNDIKFYLDNPKKVWQDISISEVKDGKEIKGFKVTNINKSSKIAQLGLKKGDIMIRANNVELNSYSAVLNIYKNINQLDTIEIVVLRGNEEKELVYEIN